MRIQNWFVYSCIHHAGDQTAKVNISLSVSVIYSNIFWFDRFDREIYKVPLLMQMCYRSLVG